MIPFLCTILAAVGLYLAPAFTLGLLIGAGVVLSSEIGLLIRHWLRMRGYR